MQQVLAALTVKKEEEREVPTHPHVEAAAVAPVRAADAAGQEDDEGEPGELGDAGGGAVQPPNSESEQRGLAEEGQSIATTEQSRAHLLRDVKGCSRIHLLR